MSEIEKYYSGEIHVDFEEDKPLLTKEEAEEYYNKLWLENKELIQENIDRLDKKRFAQALMIAEKDKEIERLNNIINELEKWLKEEYEGTIFDYHNAIEDVLNKLQELKGSESNE